MVHESIRNLRLDRRLLERPGWIEAGELERELAALPDAADKAAPLEEGEAAEGSAGVEPERAPEA